MSSLNCERKSVVFPHRFWYICLRFNIKSKQIDQIGWNWWQIIPFLKLFKILMNNNKICWIKLCKTILKVATFFMSRTIAFSLGIWSFNQKCRAIQISCYRIMIYKAPTGSSFHPYMTSLFSTVSEGGEYNWNQMHVDHIYKNTFKIQTSSSFFPKNAM